MGVVKAVDGICWRNAVDCADFDALEEAARAVLPASSFAFCATGADDEITSAENITAWRRMRLRPYVLRDISNADTSVSLLGARVATPIMVAPMGRHRLFHAEGERASARGAAAAGAVYAFATSANVLLEEAAASAAARRNGSSSICGPSAMGSKR